MQRNREGKVKIFPKFRFNTKCRENGQRCTESEIFDSNPAPASAEYTPSPLRNILIFWTPTPA